MTGLRATLRFLRCTVPFTALLACPAVVPAPAHAQQDDSALPAAAKAPAMTYRGFTVDDSAVQADGLAELRSTMRQQLDMVLAVGLAPEVVAFLQAVPVVVHPAGSFARPSAGRYVGRARQVEVTEDLVLRRHRPVLLHEFMHALHHQWVPRGLGNRELLSLYRAAQSLTAYHPRSHMMSNVQEFFACSATTYLYGATEQEPFTREKLQAAQPELMGLLASWFGPSAGRHVAPGLN